MYRLVFIISLLQIIRHFLFTFLLVVFWTFEDTIAEPRDYCESLCAGTYFIAIYCRHSLDFIIGYFKTFSNSISNFDSYGISIDFSGNNSKTFSNDVYSFESYGVFVGFSFDNFKASNSFVAWLCMDCERVSTGTSLYDSTPL